MDESIEIIVYGEPMRGKYVWVTENLDTRVFAWYNGSTDREDVNAKTLRRYT